MGPQHPPLAPGWLLRASLHHAPAVRIAGLGSESSIVVSARRSSDSELRRSRNHGGSVASAPRMAANPRAGPGRIRLLDRRLFRQYDRLARPPIPPPLRRPLRIDQL